MSTRSFVTSLIVGAIVLSLVIGAVVAFAGPTAVESWRGVIQPTKEVDKVIAAAPVPASTPRVTEAGATGITTETLMEYLEDTQDVGALIAVLDRDWETSYDLGHRGEWSGPVNVECISVGWFDTRTGKAPEGAETYRRQGGWGVYKFPEGFKTPSNTAGRWICLSTR